MLYQIKVHHINIGFTCFRFGSQSKITLSKLIKNDGKKHKTVDLNETTIASIQHLEPARFGYSQPTPASQQCPNIVAGKYHKD